MQPGIAANNSVFLIRVSIPPAVAHGIYCRRKKPVLFVMKRNCEFVTAVGLNNPPSHIYPPGHDVRLELKLIIVIRCQIGRIHPHHRLHRWRHGGSRGCGNFNRRCVDVADIPRSLSVMLVTHAAGYAGNRAGSDNTTGQRW